MRTQTILKASFTLGLVVLCTVAAVALVATPAAEALSLSNCPAPCPPGFWGVSSGETCNFWHPDCIQECRIWRTSGGDKCYTDCYSL